mmetsp:Transcript_36148/g.103979  ORF Transcript_36148/g.103979 Transcript_36148/m.103979 type:complete len:217 (+) Transcript_36148:618-1268(+)
MRSRVCCWRAWDSAPPSSPCTALWCPPTSADRRPRLRRRRCSPRPAAPECWWPSRSSPAGWQWTCWRSRGLSGACSWRTSPASLGCGLSWTDRPQSSPSRACSVSSPHTPALGPFWDWGCRSCCGSLGVAAPSRPCQHPRWQALHSPWRGSSATPSASACRCCYTIKSDAGTQFSALRRSWQLTPWFWWHNHGRTAKVLSSSLVATESSMGRPLRL